MHSLPSEILDQIFMCTWGPYLCTSCAKLCYSDDYIKKLKGVSTICRTWHQTFLRAAYRQVRFKTDSLDFFSYYKNKLSNGELGLEFVKMGLNKAVAFNRTHLIKHLEIVLTPEDLCNEHTLRSIGAAFEEAGKLAAVESVKLTTLYDHLALYVKGEVTADKCAASTRTLSALVRKHVPNAVRIEVYSKTSALYAWYTDSVMPLLDPLSGSASSVVITDSFVTSRMAKWGGMAALTQITLIKSSKKAEAVKLIQQSSASLRTLRLEALGFSPFPEIMLSGDSMVEYPHLEYIKIDMQNSKRPTVVPAEVVKGTPFPKVKKFLCYRRYPFGVSKGFLPWGKKTVEHIDISLNSEDFVAMLKTTQVFRKNSHPMLRVLHIQTEKGSDPVDSRGILSQYIKLFSAGPNLSSLNIPRHVHDLAPAALLRAVPKDATRRLNRLDMDEWFFTIEEVLELIKQLPCSISQLNISLVCESEFKINDTLNKYHKEYSKLTRHARIYITNSRGHSCKNYLAKHIVALAYLLPDCAIDVEYKFETHDEVLKNQIDVVKRSPVLSKYKRAAQVRKLEKNNHY